MGNTPKIGFDTQSAAVSYAQSLAEKYRPRTIDDFIGVDDAKKKAHAIIKRPVPMSAFLFAGDSGTGKTTMALAIAAGLNAQLHHVPARAASKETIESIWESVHYTTWTGSGWHVVLMDEIDLWRSDLQQLMLSIWDSMGSLPNAMFGDWQPSAPQVIWIGTTNQEPHKSNGNSSFDKRYLSRLRVIPISSYGMAPAIADHLRFIWASEAPEEAAPPDFTKLVKNANNNVSNCLMNLELELMEV